MTTQPPAQLQRTRDAVQTLGQLFQCIDPERWNSIGRPSATGLSALFFLVAEGLNQGLADIALPPGL